MYQQTIDQILKQDIETKKYFIGVFARDELPHQLTYPCCFVLNTQNRSEHGEHWLAFLYNSKRICYFFDSYGLSPYFYNLNNYVENSSNNVVWNMRRLQGESNYCGFYCILFLIYACRNKLGTFFNKFNLKLNENDFIITKELFRN